MSECTCKYYDRETGHLTLCKEAFRLFTEMIESASPINRTDFRRHEVLAVQRLERERLAAERAKEGVPQPTDIYQKAIVGWTSGSASRNIWLGIHTAYDMLLPFCQPAIEQRPTSVPTLDELSQEWRARHDEHDGNDPLYRYVYDRLLPYCVEQPARAEKPSDAEEIGVDGVRLESGDQRHLHGGNDSGRVVGVGVVSGEIGALVPSDAERHDAYKAAEKGWLDSPANTQKFLNHANAEWMFDAGVDWAYERGAGQREALAEFPSEEESEAAWWDSRTHPRPYDEDTIPPFEAWTWSPISVRTNLLIPTQPKLVIDRLAALQGGADPYGEDSCPHVVSIEGRLYLHDGHHRWATAWLRRDPEMLVRVWAYKQKREALAVEFPSEADSEAAAQAAYDSATGDGPNWYAGWSDCDRWYRSLLHPKPPEPDPFEVWWAESYPDVDDKEWAREVWNWNAALANEP